MRQSDVGLGYCVLAELLREEFVHRRVAGKQDHPADFFVQPVDDIQFFRELGGQERKQALFALLVDRGQPFRLVHGENVGRLKENMDH